MGHNQRALLTPYIGRPSRQLAQLERVGDKHVAQIHPRDDRIIRRRDNFLNVRHDHGPALGVGLGQLRVPRHRAEYRAAPLSSAFFG